MLQATWSTTDNSSLTFMSDKCVLLTLERLLSTGRPAVSETGPSQLLEPECGAVCPQTWDNRDCHTASSGGHWRHFYLDSETTAQCEHFKLRRLEIFLLTYFVRIFVSGRVINCHVQYNFIDLLKLRNVKRPSKCLHRHIQWYDLIQCTWLFCLAPFPRCLWIKRLCIIIA